MERKLPSIKKNSSMPIYVLTGSLCIVHLETSFHLIFVWLGCVFMLVFYLLVLVFWAILIFAFFEWSLRSSRRVGYSNKNVEVPASPNPTRPRCHLLTTVLDWCLKPKKEKSNPSPICYGLTPQTQRGQGQTVIVIDSFQCSLFTCQYSACLDSSLLSLLNALRFSLLSCYLATLGRKYPVSMQPWKGLVCHLVPRRFLDSGSRVNTAFRYAQVWAWFRISYARNGRGKWCRVE